MRSDDLLRRHYREEADRWGESPFSTMDDEIIRARETDLVLKFVDALGRSPLRIGDIGCGNGYTLQLLTRHWPGHRYWGVDFTRELLDIARSRGLVNCEFIEGNASSLEFDDSFFDAVYTQRCLINILDWEGQKAALGEIHRALKPGGHYLMIECFTDGLLNNNRARRECGLTELKQANHNSYLDKELLLQAVEGRFSVIEPDRLGAGLPPSNFLSSHYFVARVLHALVTKGEQTKNTEFVKFFSFLPPIGNYSPIQAFVLTRV